MGEAAGEEGEEVLVVHGDSTRPHPLSCNAHHMQHLTTQVSCHIPLPSAKPHVYSVHAMYMYMYTHCNCLGSDK